MDINALILNWHKKDSEDCFSGFVFQYLAFIANLKKVRYVWVWSDRLAIQNLKRETSLRDAYFALISSDKGLENAWLEIINELNKSPLWNISHNWTISEDDKWWNCSTDTCSLTPTKWTIQGINDWVNMVEFWYAIRNNLFHGGKDPQDGRDEFLVTQWYITLKPFVAILIK